MRPHRSLHFDRLLGAGVVQNYAALARRGHVTRARITQIMNLLHLAPDLQEQLLFLPRTQQGRDPVTEQKVRAVAACTAWDDQRQAWVGILGGAGRGGADRVSARGVDAEAGARAGLGCPQ